jgi:hypothetical protein
VWLVTLVLVALAATLGARDLLDDEFPAQRMAVVATTVAPDRRLDRARLEQLVDSELAVLSGDHASVAVIVESASTATSDRWHHALIEDRLTRAVTGSLTPAPRSLKRWLIAGCIALLVTAGAIRHPLVMVLAYVAAMALLVVGMFPHVRAAVTAAHAAEVVMPIGVETDRDDIEAVVQIRLRHISRGRRRPTRRARRYTDEPLAQRRLHTFAAASGTRWSPDLARRVWNGAIRASYRVTRDPARTASRPSEDGLVHALRADGEVVRECQSTGPVSVAAHGSACVRSWRRMER